MNIFTLKYCPNFFFAEAALAGAQHKPEHSLACYEKSQILTEFLEENDKTWSARREERKAVLREKISATRLSILSK